MGSSSRPRSRSDFAAHRAVVLAATVLLAALLAGPREARAVDFEVVVSPDVPAESVTFDELQRLFRFQKRFWRPGQPVNVILPSTGSDAHAFLLAKVLRTSDGSLHRAIVEKMYRGEMDRAPRTAGSDDEAVALAASGRGLIALVMAGEPRPAGTRILTVDSHRPGDAGYALRR